MAADPQVLRLGVDHSRKRGVRSEEDPDKHKQGSRDDRRNPNADPGDRVAAAQKRRQWYWSPTSNQYYYYDAQNDMLVLQDGREVKRPAHVPRTLFNSAGPQRAATSSGYPTADRNYTVASQIPDLSRSTQCGPESRASVASQASSRRPSKSPLTQSFERTATQRPQAASGSSGPPDSALRSPKQNRPAVGRDQLARLLPDRMIAQASTKEQATQHARRLRRTLCSSVRIEDSDEDDDDSCEEEDSDEDG
ncbi:hypothetical protein LTR37_019568 [Vermiconidia calcicola]|uniref:Uncharacterized protein n=1 Tax=Vermiconidia calcicola TaxID=1690605 RepID=A0ACC3MFA5_9PEZI|nr:hypothetical protein LTR37_019568 [Vermiconidia calcicola]